MFYIVGKLYDEKVRSFTLSNLARVTSVHSVFPLLNHTFKTVLN